MNKYTEADNAPATYHDVNENRWMLEWKIIAVGILVILDILIGLLK